ncbi:MAG: YciI family protein [Deltaproteobacteria bacterium]|nr:YciI family protein [Deltaproteobacteria bacterium]
MRFMVIVYPGPRAEAGELPSEKELTAMGKFNEELVNAGVMLAGEGLHPSSKGARIRYPGGKPKVSDGPFTESKEIIGGFWLMQVKSKEEVVEWLKRCPMGPDDMVEIRQVFESEDFGAELTPELKAQEDRMREKSGMAAKK